MQEDFLRYSRMRVSAASFSPLAGDDTRTRMFVMRVPVNMTIIRSTAKETLVQVSQFQWWLPLLILLAVTVVLPAVATTVFLAHLGLLSNWRLELSPLVSGSYCRDVLVWFLYLGVLIVILRLVIEVAAQAYRLSKTSR